MSEPALPLPVEAPEVSAPPPPKPLNGVVRWLCGMLLDAVQMAPADIDRIRALSRRGAIVYVLRQRSWVDNVLVTYLLEREGLPAPSFANDMRALWMRPLPSMLQALWLGFSQLRPRSQELRGFADREHCRDLVAQRHPVLLFMRGRRPRWRFGRRRRLPGMHHGRDYIREIVHDHWQSDQEVFFVPLVPLRGRGMRRKESRLASLVYSLQETPSEFRRLLSLLRHRRDTSIGAGAEVAQRDFLQRYRREGEERTVRRLSRALLIYLYREERVVWGPLLLSKRQVRSLVLGTDDVERTIRHLVEESGENELQLRRRARRTVDEMAADYKNLYFSILEFGFNQVWPRMFAGLEYRGLERVVACVKKHPVVLVPCHRSHFDYLVLSYLFHLKYLSPPHIAAGINLSFWPMGPLFRGAGAYFIRRTFEGDELYKAVFRQYLTFLIREGYTQEFFIEGGRSRTGKVLPPKLGVLSAIVEAFTGGARRDLYFVPVSIHYGRVVEEDAYQRELGGAEKQPESLRALVQARRVLRRRHGTVYVSFAEPLSLNEFLGSDRAKFGQGGDEVADARRGLVRKLGLRLLREINRASVVGATSVSATVLLSVRPEACREDDFVRRAKSLVSFLRRREIRLSASLERNAAADFRESLGFLESGGLVERLSGMGGDVVRVPTEKRLALDFYKNNSIHYFLQSSLLLDAIVRGKTGDAADADVEWWLDLFRWEFPLPDRGCISSELADLRAVLRQEGVLVGESDGVGGDQLRVPTTFDGGDQLFAATVIGALDNFREAYWVMAQVLRDFPEGAVTVKSILELARKRHETALVLNELSKPEGSSSAIFDNAIKRYAEIGFIRLDGGRDPAVAIGPCHGEIDLVESRVAESLSVRATA